MRETDLAAEDVSALNDMLRNMEASWARGDGAGYAAAFTDDARYVTASGTRAVGRQDIAATHQKIFDSVFRGTTLGVSYPVELQPVTPTVVLVHGSGTVIFPGSSEQTLRPTALLTMVAVNDGDAWRLAAFSNTPVGAVDRVA